MTRRLLALSCRAFPPEHRARTSDEIVDTALLASDGSAWRAAGEAASLVGAGIRQRLRAERGMSVRSGVALVAQLLALLNLAVALCGVSLVVDTPSYRVPPPLDRGLLRPDAYTFDWWWIAFGLSALGVVVGVALGRRAVALGAALANVAIVGYDALVLSPNGHFWAFVTSPWTLAYPVFWTWLPAAAVLVLAVIAAPLRRSLGRLPVVITCAVLLDVIARAHADGFFFLQWPVGVVILLAVVFGLWAPRLAVVAIGASLALGPLALWFSAQLAWHLGFRSLVHHLTPLLALCVVSGLLLPLAYLARRRLA